MRIEVILRLGQMVEAVFARVSVRFQAFNEDKRVNGTRPPPVTSELAKLKDASEVNAVRQPKSNASNAL